MRTISLNELRKRILKEALELKLSYIDDYSERDQRHRGMRELLADPEYLEVCKMLQELEEDVVQSEQTTEVKR